MDVISELFICGGIIIALYCLLIIINYINITFLLFSIFIDTKSFTEKTSSKSFWKARFFFSFLINTDYITTFYGNKIKGTGLDGRSWVLDARYYYIFVLIDYLKIN
jgi:hypothetical protein